MELFSIRIQRTFQLVSTRVYKREGRYNRHHAVGRPKCKIRIEPLPDTDYLHRTINQSMS